LRWNYVVPGGSEELGVKNEGFDHVLAEQLHRRRASAFETACAVLRVLIGRSFGRDAPLEVAGEYAALQTRRSVLSAVQYTVTSRSAFESTEAAVGWRRSGRISTMLPFRVLIDSGSTPAWNASFAG
jgi:hypothetical protein